MLYNALFTVEALTAVVNCFQFCNNFDVVQPTDMEFVNHSRCELLSIL